MGGSAEERDQRLGGRRGLIDLVIVEHDHGLARRAPSQRSHPISYYENARSGLGHRFADEVERVIALTLEAMRSSYSQCFTASGDRGYWKDRL
jgi:hypothetical protein